MGHLYIFVIRLIVAIVVSFIICWFFFQATPMIKVLGLAAILLGLAYLFEYTRKRDGGGKHGDY